MLAELHSCEATRLCLMFSNSHDKRSKLSASVDAIEISVVVHAITNFSLQIIQCAVQPKNMAIFS